MRHVFIINPAAGKYDCTEEIRAQIEALSETENIELIVTTGKGDATEKARELAQSGEELRIYACGGDGTANEVLTGIAGFDNCALGIIPMGSGNDFVRSMDKHQREDFLDVRRMIEGEEHRIDLMECNGHYSMNVFSVGYDCAVGKNVDRFKGWPLVNGSLAYKLSIIYCLFSKRKHPVRIQIDGEDFQKADYKNTTLLAVAGNGKYYGGGIKAAPLADLSDGLIDFIHVPTLPVLKFIFIIGKYIKGEHINNPKFSFLTFKRCKKLKFIAEEPIDVNLDGEIYSVKDPELTIIPGALRIIEPAVSAKKPALSKK